MKLTFYLTMFFLISNGYAQENLSYQKPPIEIMDLVDAPSAPYSMIDENNEYIVLRFRDPFKTIAEHSEKEYHLRGLEMDPTKNINSRVFQRQSLFNPGPVNILKTHNRISGKPRVNDKVGIPDLTFLLKNN